MMLLLSRALPFIARGLPWPVVLCCLLHVACRALPFIAHGLPRPAICFCYTMPYLITPPLAGHVALCHQLS
jgi:hypothetical protein